jgi:protein-tyrosine phosphatase
LPGLVDIHAHLLPGIDDGPPDLESALRMARAAVAGGIEVIAATPHLRGDFPDVHVGELSDRRRHMVQELAAAEVPLRIVSGAEVSLVWGLEASDDQLTLASYGQRGRDLLVETPFGNVHGLDRLLFEFQARGYRVTLAHPERNHELQRDLAPLEEMVARGILLQVNADSLLEPNRRSRRRRTAERLCREGLAHVLASDGHGAGPRRPVGRLPEAAEVAAALVGPERTDWLLRSAPAAVLAGDRLPEPPPIVTSRKGLRLRRS